MAVRSGRGAHPALRAATLAGAAVALYGSAWAAPVQAETYQVVGDAIPSPLGGLVGDASRGRALVTDRRAGLCLLCHSGPFPEERFQGDLSSDLSGAGSRWSPGQLRLRLADARRLNPDTVMPAYHRTAGLRQVAGAWQGRPIFSAQQVEDVVSFLETLK
jgi:sulfur-oxidizing protein SoxX